MPLYIILEALRISRPFDYVYRYILTLLSIYLLVYPIAYLVLYYAISLYTIRYLPSMT